MRERRWESKEAFEFDDILALGRRLDGLGFKPASPGKEIISYIEEWTVADPYAIERLEAWTKEDVTMVHVREAWRGDFYLLAGAYHTIYQRQRQRGTYCSVSHPWKINVPLTMHHPRAMFWTGFRDHHSFIRVRLDTKEVIAPGETRADDQRDFWVEERTRAFRSAISILDLPIETDKKNEKAVLETAEPDAVLLCSWPDAFGPCQFEYNTPNAFEFLVPAGRLAATWNREPATVRAYLTGFSEQGLKEFETTEPGERYAYRCSVHATLEELPELLKIISSPGGARILPDGRLYTTLCEFQSDDIEPDAENAWVIIGIVGTKNGWTIEARLNRAPLPEDRMAAWLENLLGFSVAYAPLPPFP